MRVGLVSCSKDKYKITGMASKVYSKSQLFQDASEYAQWNYDSWYILSAKYGLLEPQTVIDWYDLSLANLTRYGRSFWADKVGQQLRNTLPADAHLYIHAGELYRAPLEPELQRRGFTYSVPLRGLQIGMQRKFYKDHRAGVSLPSILS